MHVNTHYLLVFCPCGQHDVYPYPVIAHMASGRYPGLHYVVKADTYLEFLTVIRPLVKMAFILGALTAGFQTVLKYTRQQSPMVSEKPEAVFIPDEPTCNEEEAESPPG